MSNLGYAVYRLSRACPCAIFVHRFYAKAWAERCFDPGQWRVEPITWQAVDGAASDPPARPRSPEASPLTDVGPLEPERERYAVRCPTCCMPWTDHPTEASGSTCARYRPNDAMGGGKPVVHLEGIYLAAANGKGAGDRR